MYRYSDNLIADSCVQVISIPSLQVDQTFHKYIYHTCTCMSTAAGASTYNAHKLQQRQKDINWKFIVLKKLNLMDILISTGTYSKRRLGVKDVSTYL